MTPWFPSSNECAPVVAELCRRLDGLPLALELAAARLRSLAPETIVERLDVRSHLLAAGARSLEARHRTLRHSIGWSYDLLSKPEQSLFTQLSVLAGSFDLDAVEAVCAPLVFDAGDDVGVDTVDLLVALVDNSMVQVVDRQPSRYQLLETLSEYGRDHLDDGANDQVSDAHLRWFRGEAERAGHELAGSDEAAWSRRVGAEFDNFRSSHARAIRVGDVDTALRIVAGLREYAFRRIRYELASWAATAANVPGASEHIATLSFRGG